MELLLYKHCTSLPVMKSKNDTLKSFLTRNSKPGESANAKSYGSLPRYLQYTQLEWLQVNTSVMTEGRSFGRVCVGKQTFTRSGGRRMADSS